MFIHELAEVSDIIYLIARATVYLLLQNVANFHRNSTVANLYTLYFGINSMDNYGWIRREKGFPEIQDDIEQTKNWHLIVHNNIPFASDFVVKQNRKTSLKECLI